MSSGEETDACSDCGCDPCECAEYSEDSESVELDLTPVATGPVAYAKPKVRTLADLEKMMEERIEEVSNLICVPRSKAIVLLMKNAWSPRKVNDAMFDGGKRTELNKHRAGMRDTPETPAAPDGEFECGVCMVDTAVKDSLCLTCEHRYCKDCWDYHLALMVREAKVDATCMQRGCRQIIDEEDIARMAPDLLSKYKRFLLHNFKAHNKAWKECTNPLSCDNIIEYDGGQDDAVVCKCACGYDFCWACSKEDHRPCTCAVAAQWLEKLEDQSGDASLALIRANCRPCPGCKQEIWKNQGCNHMTCRPPGGCGYEFCWICFEEWGKHGGDYFSCAKMNKGNLQMAHEIDPEAAKVKATLDEFLHYATRFEAQLQSQKYELRDLEKANQKATNYYNLDGCGWNGDFIVEASELSVRCRVALKWSFAYGFFSREFEGKDLFDHQQEQLSHSVEELTKLSQESIEVIRQNPEVLKNRIGVCSTFLKNMVDAWEERLRSDNGFPAV